MGNQGGGLRDDRISEPVPVATILDHAPEPVKATRCQAPLDRRPEGTLLVDREADYFVFDGLCDGGDVARACKQAGTSAGPSHVTFTA